MVEAPRPKNSIEAVASAPSGVRTAAIDLALLRTPGAITDMAAIRTYFQEVIGSGDKKEAARGTSVGGLTATQLNQIWSAGEALIKRAEAMLRLRGARAWSYELSKPKDGHWANEQFVGLIFHALEHGEHASHYLASQLMSPAARGIARMHRGRIEKGVEMYEKYLGYAKKAHGDPHDVQEILEEWQHPPYVTEPSPRDTRPANYRDDVGRQRAENLLRGHVTLEEMIKKNPSTQSRFENLAPEEKIVYVEYLGLSPQNRLVARSLYDYHRMSPILAKMEGADPYPARKTFRERVKEVAALRKNVRARGSVDSNSASTVSVPELPSLGSNVPSPVSAAEHIQTSSSPDTLPSPDAVFAAMDDAQFTEWLEGMSDEQYQNRAEEIAAEVERRRG